MGVVSLIIVLAGVLSCFLEGYFTVVFWLWALNLILLTFCIAHEHNGVVAISYSL